MKAEMEILTGIVLAGVLTGAVVADIRRGRIPNVLTFSAMAAGVGLNGAGGGAHGAAMSFAGLGAGAALLVVPFLLGGMGGGDVKLMAAVGALMGSEFVFYTFIFGGIVGGLVALGRLALRRGERAAVWARVRSDLVLAASGALPEAETKRAGIPYAVCIAAGAALAAALWARVTFGFGGDLS